MHISKLALRTPVAFALRGTRVGRVGRSPRPGAHKALKRPARAARRACAVREAALADDNPDVAAELARAYCKLQRPAKYNVTYSKAVEIFCHWCITAYECGYREDDLMLKLTEACDRSQSQMPATQVRPCVDVVCLVWLVLESSAKPVFRWAKSPPVTDSTQQRWRGFVALIVNAYFNKRMASYPLENLQMELAALGRMERLHIVAEFSRLAFDTLHRVAPQFPRR